MHMVIAPVIPVVLALAGVVPVGAATAGATGSVATAVRAAVVARDVIRAVPRPGWQPPLAKNPVVGRPFDPPAERWGRGHRGVDLRARPGAKVVAPANGVVVFAGRVGKKPTLSILHANGVRTTYEPVIATVKVGQPVGRGAAVGRLAPGHCPPGSCLHWGARRGGEYLDPLSLLPQLSPVLLPQG